MTADRGEKMRVAPVIELSAEEERQLTRLAKSNTASVRAARRAQIVLLAAGGVDNHEIAERLGVGRVQVGRWRNRYAEGGLAAISQDLPRGGRHRTIDAEEIVRLTTQTKPENATHWSTRSLAAATGVSATTIRRIWRAHGLKPHRVTSFKVSRDPQFVEKLEDIVGLYLNPPAHALVLCCDEKSQVQALDRTQPGLPMKKGRAETMTHDYKRHGTTTLFAALNALDGTVIAQCQQRHRHTEWLKFLPADRSRNAEGQRAAPDLRQLRGAQAPESESVAGQAPTVQRSLHADLGIVVEHGGAFLQGYHDPTITSRRVQERSGVNRCDRGLRQSTQRRSKTVHLDCQGQRHPGEGR